MHFWEGSSLVSRITSGRPSLSRHLTLLQDSTMWNQLLTSSSAVGIFFSNQLNHQPGPGSVYSSYGPVQNKVIIDFQDFANTAVTTRFLPSPTFICVSYTSTATTRFLPSPTFISVPCASIATSRFLPSSTFISVSYTSTATTRFLPSSTFISVSYTSTATTGFLPSSTYISIPMCLCWF
ncbi:hypothetical protein PoB_006262200 [Plakobranchus ocellatus]|uniref:Uncharacterized protein n=1 Tax=Plakobranchus ocellatus TaxID=259542 RepID=A0AAV4CW34_9GAST|nr:hypothetical protein PoB_006262200 [Plakobranchus ocellatus]